jgi:hypothetical protein
MKSSSHSNGVYIAPRRRSDAASPSGQLGRQRRLALFVKVARQQGEKVAFLFDQVVLEHGMKLAAEADAIRRFDPRRLEGFPDFPHGLVLGFHLRDQTGELAADGGEQDIFFELEMALRQVEYAPEELIGCCAGQQCLEKRLERRLDEPVLGHKMSKQRPQTLSLRLS